MAALILWIVGIGAIASWLMSQVWSRKHRKVYQWQFWLFRVNGVAGSLVGFITGFQFGDKLAPSQTCEGLAAFRCAADGLANIFFGSLLGTGLGAMIGVLGSAILLKKL